MTCKDCIHSGLCYKENDYVNFPDKCGSFIYDKVLEERPQGEWVLDSDNLPICKECGEVALQRMFIKLPQRIQDVRMVRSNYCPNCGADMRRNTKRKGTPIEGNNESYNCENWIP